jgi:FkbM family methyltransferase
MIGVPHQLLYKMWRRIARSQRMKSLRTDVRLLRTYGTRTPERIRLANSANDIFLDPTDERARTIIRGLGRGLQPALRQLWHQAVLHLQPTIVLDVGVNYGEFLFAETYAPGTRLIGVEANQRLEQWISRSIAAHPNRGQIEIVYALASDSVQDAKPFYVDAKWSGSSSAVPGGRGAEELSVRAISIDSLLEGRDLHTDTLLFKIDTEGYEPFVLKGMQASFARCQHLLGIVEFDTQRMTPLGVDLDELLRRLSERFTIHMLDHRGSRTRLDEPRVRRMQELLGSEHIVADLLLASDSGLLERLHVSQL